MLFEILAFIFYLNTTVTFRQRETAKHINMEIPLFIRYSKRQTMNKLFKTIPLLH